MAANGNGMSKSAVGFIAGLAFAAGLFIGVVVSGELGRETVDPGTPVAEVGPAQQAQVSPDMARQISNLEQAAAERPNDASIWIQLGNSYYDTNQPQKAINAYERALAIAPGNPDVLTDLGVMYRVAGQPQKAVELFDKAIAAAPEHQIARLNKGVVLLHDLGDREGALRAWEGLLALNPDAAAPGGRPVADIVKELRAGAQAK